MERSETALLLPERGQAPDPAPLLAAFRPQLARQGWKELDVQEAKPGDLCLCARTPQGYGLLGLRAGGGAVQAKIVHVSFEGEGQDGMSSYTLYGG